MLRLEIDGVRAGYGAGPSGEPVGLAVDGVTLALGPGEAAALLGRNGAGKTTTVRAIMGLLPLAGGDVRIDGRSVRGSPPFARARLGLGLVPEGRRVWAPLTVAENLVAAARPPAQGAGPGWTLPAVLELFPRLAERRGQAAGSLSGGERGMLAIGRALLTNPRALVLDEATEGLAPLVRGEIWAALARLKAAGMALLVIDRDLAALAGFVDRAYVLEKGRPVWQGPGRELRSPAFADRHLGVGPGPGGGDGGGTPANERAERDGR